MTHDPCNPPKMVTHLTHDPWPTDPFPSLVASTWCTLYEVLWRHRLGDQTIRHRPIPNGGSWIFASKYIWVTIFGHLMLLVMWDNGPQTLWGHDIGVTWPLDSPYPISYSCSIVTSVSVKEFFQSHWPVVPCVCASTRKLWELMTPRTFSLRVTLYPIQYQQK